LRHNQLKDKRFVELYLLPSPDPLVFMKGPGPNFSGRLSLTTLLSKTPFDPGIKTSHE